MMRKLTSIIILLFIVFKASASTLNDSTFLADSIYKNIALGEVTVKGHRPIVKNKGSKLSINVKGSFLANMGNLGNVLSATPGIIMKGTNQFEVVGRGTPIYYVDGKEMTVQDIFTTINSNNIEKIEVDREPSAEYPTGTTAVIKITTIKPLKDYLALDINTSASIRRKLFYSPPSFNFSTKKGIWASSISYRYGMFKSLNKETYFTEIHHPDYIFRTDEANHLLTTSRTHTVNWNNNLQLSKTQQVNFGYYFQHNERSNQDEEITAYQGQVTSWDKDITRNRTNIRNLHDFSLNYKGNFGKNILSAGMDYVLTHDNSNLLTQEQNENTKSLSEVVTKNKGCYNILTFNASYTFSLPYKIQGKIGVRYYQTHHPLDYFSNNPALPQELSANHQGMDDNVTAGYFLLSRKWKKITIDLYGRYEYADTRIKASNIEGTYEKGRHSSDFLPTAQLTYDINDDWEVQLIYQKSVKRQGYQGLSPYPEYKDSLTYSLGNSELLPAYTDKWALYLTWKGWSLNVIYSSTKDEITNVQYCPDLMSNIINDMPVNMPRSKHWDIELGYSKMFNKLNLSSFVSLGIPRDKYVFLDKEYETNKVSASININLSYRITNSFTCYTSFDYQSANESLNDYQKMASNWIIGLQKSFFKKRLSFNLVATDILHKAHYNNICSKYINTQYGTYGTNDLRGVTLSCSYKLFNKNIKVKSSRNSEDVINRTL